MNLCFLEKCAALYDIFCGAQRLEDSQGLLALP